MAKIPNKNQKKVVVTYKGLSFTRPSASRARKINRLIAEAEKNHTWVPDELVRPHAYKTAYKNSLKSICNSLFRISSVIIKFRGGQIYSTDEKTHKLILKQVDGAKKKGDLVPDNFRKRPLG